MMLYAPEIFFIRCVCYYALMCNNQTHMMFAAGRDMMSAETCS